MSRIYQITLIGLCVVLSFTVRAQLVVTSGATLTINSNETVTLAGINLQNNAGGTITHAGNIVMLGNATDRDIINNGTLNGNNGTITMTGINEQQIQGNAVVNIGNFVVNNGGNGVSVTNSGGLRIHNTLTLTNGRLFTSDNSPVYFTPTATNPVETNTNHIQGTAIMETRNVGTSAFDFLMLQMPMGADVGNLTLTRKSGDGGATSRGFATAQGTPVISGFEGIDAHWIIDITNHTGTRDVTWSWLPAWDNGKILTQMSLWKTLPMNISNYWFSHTVALNLSSRTHTQNNLLLSELDQAWSFSDHLNPLPVDLVSFQVSLKDENVEVTWKSQNEHQIKGYTIERSIDNLNFQPIGFADAKNQPTNHYSYLDTDAKKQGKSIIYYRLLILEKDGSSRYSDVQAIKLPQAQEFVVSIYPNPFQDELNIQIKNPEKHEVHLKLIDNLGKIISQASLEGSEEIQHKITGSAGFLATGTYFLYIEKNNTTKVYKVVKK
ncbi:MAG: T9SS type A sorting domain-containing protein [Bacteroidia bacterium]|nr:T9SS type A sorting domain-containing protein [Bacteroidia bacterium]MDW8302941.1 T9SS type A sorting domain-containing protein [Bacteroidia bacterium]